MTVEEIIRNNSALFPKDLRKAYRDIAALAFRMPAMPSHKDLVRAHDALQLKTTGPPIWSTRCCMLVHGMNGLRDLFFRANGIAGRLDLTFPFEDVTSMCGFLALVGKEPGRPELTRWRDRLFRCSNFVILGDVSISGNSLLDDVMALERCLHSLGSRRSSFRLQIIVFSGTTTAERKLRSVCDDIVVLNQIPDSFRLRGDSKIQRLHGRRKVEEVCEWFRDEILPPDSHLHKMSEMFDDPEILLWGFGAEGWLVVGSTNTPNNSLPLLWLDSEPAAYVAPHPRLPSRLYDECTWNLKESYLSILEALRASGPPQKDQLAGGEVIRDISQSGCVAPETVGGRCRAREPSAKPIHQRESQREADE